MFHSIASVASRAASRWHDARRIRRDVARMRVMSDHELQDIGLTRAEIPRVDFRGRLGPAGGAATVPARSGAWEFGTMAQPRPAN